MQVRDGRIMTDDFGKDIPACCPEGVYATEVPEHFCGCSDNKLDNPYRLEVRVPIVNDDSVVEHRFRVLTTTVQTPSRDPDNKVDCSNMDIDRLRLYIKPEYMDQVEKVEFGGEERAFEYGEDAAQVWIQLLDLGIDAQPFGTSMDFKITLKADAPTMPSLCANNAIGTAECEYVFYGKWNLALLDFDCCAHGWSDPDAIIDSVPEEMCDQNTFHSPYVMDFNSISYDSQDDATTVSFNITFVPEHCDVYDPTNKGCCDADVKSIFLGMKGDNVQSVTTTPDLKPALSTENDGIKVVGVFGQGMSFVLDVTVAGEQTVTSLTTGITYAGNGFRYRLYGGVHVDAPAMCCPAHYTGDGSELFI